MPFPHTATPFQPLPRATRLKVLSLPLVYPGSSTLEEVLLSGGTADDLRLPGELGGGYMTSFEVICQLHCLNLIRKATYYDYYKDKAIEFTNKPRTVRLHIGNFFSLLPHASILSCLPEASRSDSRKQTMV